MPNIDPTYLPRIYRCEECRHILGVVLRDSRRIRRLWVLREQLPSESNFLDNYMIRQSVTNSQGSRSIWRICGMDSGWIKCDHCNAVQEWRASEEALVDLLQRIGGKDVVAKYQELMKGTIGQPVPE